VSAPRFFSPLRTPLLVTFVALVAAGCTIPGSSRLEGPPAGLPPSLDLVTADALGYLLVDTDPASKLWEPLDGVVGGGNENPLLARLHDPVFGDGADPAAWIGDNAGLLVRQFELGDEDAVARAYFADVEDADELEVALEAAGWDRGDDPLPGPASDGEPWVRDDGDWRAAAVTEDAILAAKDEAQLEVLLEAADEYAVPERKAMREFTVEAAERSPAAFVFRADLLRTQVRRPFEDDPALLEFARWATDSNVLVALRDGWVGLAPALEEDERDDHVRVVGAAEWVPDLAPDNTLGAASPDLRAKLDPSVDVAVALDDPGQHVRELVRAITFGSGQYVTEQDVPDDGDRLELQPLLDRLDRDAAIGYRPGALEVVLEEDGRLGADVVGALDHAGVDARTDKLGDGASKVTVGRAAASRPSSAPAATFRSFTGAGKPPQAPWLWFATTGRGCVGATTGWLAFNGTDRMTLGASLELHGNRVAGADSSSLLGGCAR
jgi:hypothetical protein